MADRPRLRLRPVRESDLPLLERMFTDAEQAGEFSWYGFRSAAEMRRRFAETGELGQESGRLVIELSDGTTAGDVSWSPVRHGPTAPSLCLNIGILLFPEWRGKGLGSEAQRQLVDYLFATTSVQRIEASTDVDNLAEQRALEKVGFLREGILRQAQWRAGTWHDMVLYSRIRSE